MALTNVLSLVIRHLTDVCKIFAKPINFWRLPEKVALS